MEDSASSVLPAEDADLAGSNAVQTGRHNRTQMKKAYNTHRKGGYDRNEDVSGPREGDSCSEATGDAKIVRRKTTVARAKGVHHKSKSSSLGRLPEASQFESANSWVTSSSSSILKESIQQQDMNMAIFEGSSPSFLHKLEVYRSTFVKCLCRVHDEELAASYALSIIQVPLRELLELIPSGEEAVGYADKFRQLIHNDVLLSICFMGKASALYGASEKLEPLSSFLYAYAMRVEYLLENLADLERVKTLESGSPIPKNPKTIIDIWEKLLSLVLAKERKLRIAFCSIAYFMIKQACRDELEISQELYYRHIKTFMLITQEQNKEIRYRCLQLLENFQNDEVKRVMLAHLGDQAASVRMAAVNLIELPEDGEELLTSLRHLISRVADVSKEVRVAVYKKLGSLYNLIPVEMCYQIMSYGLAEEHHSIKNSFTQMLKSWIQVCGGIDRFISDMISQSEDLSIFEDALSFYMKNTDLLNSISLAVAEGRDAREETESMDIDRDGSSIKNYMKNFLTLGPTELVLVNVFYQNHASPDEVRLINIIDIISYAHFLLKHFCNMRSEEDQISQLFNPTVDEDGFVDAKEADETAAVYKYSEKETQKLKELYSSTRLVSHAFRALLIIAHSHPMEDTYQLALTETICDKILLYGPVSSNVRGLMSDMVAQTSLGNNSYEYTLPSRWLKAGFVFAATSMYRYIYARKFKLEGKFIGDDIQMERRHFEVSMTRKVLSVISDIKDPFQTSGVANISIRRDELERMEMKKIKEFDPSSYSIEHLNIFDAKLREQMEQTCTQHTELENVKSSKTSGKIEMEVLRKQEEALLSLLEKQMAFASIIRKHLKERWTRIMAIVEALLGQTKSLCSEDAGLAEFPGAILLPQMTFFCSTVVQWQDQSITDQFCDVLTSKCLGTWCMLNNGRMELWRQLNAFHVALRGALAILDGCINQATNNPESLNDTLRRRIEMQTLRCEMYMNTLTDLLVTNIDLQQGAAFEEQTNIQLVEDIKETIWNLVTCSSKSTKYVQSVATRQVCRLLLAEYLRNKYEEADAKDAADPQSNDELTVLRLRGLLELAFIAPMTERYISCDFKFMKSSRHVPISAEDKNAIMSVSALYPTLSYRHLRTFHKVLEQVLMRSIHHALQLEIPTGGFSHFISFMIQTILHKSPLYFAMESFAKYFKWLLLITIDKGSLLADKAGFIPLIHALIAMFINRDVTPLIHKFGLPQGVDLPAEGPVSLSELCALANPTLALLDLRDMRVLLNYIMTQTGVVKVKSNLKVLADLVEMLSQHMLKLARSYKEPASATGDASVTVEQSDPPKIVFATDDGKAFIDLVDAYDAYISSLGSRTLYAQLVEEEEEPIKEDTKPTASRKMTRAGRGPKHQQYSDMDDDSSEEDFIDEEYKE